MEFKVSKRDSSVTISGEIGQVVVRAADLPASGVMVVMIKTNGRVEVEIRD